ncbi:DUF1850 domain-containing protein [Lederbergia panacisoli]|uniref:DUF1850 domain-containing protein n=1 Tax=Lederbergia panacisoli TaxID=1255251 RepID=UPI00214B01B9|nr:DUF1850 domain-containing protein [Lederbergia panacisoli]MCR2820959.1 DUF1850 domain-containing protein [Lederbergia panacisoli]
MRYVKIILFANIIFLLFCIPFQKSLCLEKGNSGKVLAYFPLHKSNKIFHILYTHSIHLSDVKETYTILKNNQIRQIELMYEDMSIGMPSNAEKGEIFEMKDGKYTIRNMKRDFTSIDMRVAQVVGDHILMVDGHRKKFSSIAEPGSHIKLRVRRLSLWQLWRGVNIVGQST